MIGMIDLLLLVVLFPTPLLPQLPSAMLRLLPFLISIGAVGAFAPAPSLHQNNLLVAPLHSSYLDSLEASVIPNPASSFSSAPTDTPPVRRPIVAGNWKLNPATRSEAIDLFSGLASQIFVSDLSGTEAVVFPPLPYLADGLRILRGSGIKIGAQNCGSRDKGAFTGEIAPSMLATSGITHVLLGHSERRTIFGETDADINDRVRACLDQNGLTIILCVGETLEEYEAGLLTSVVDTQLRKGLEGVSESALLNGRVVIAYEPVWAIGTGLVATPEQAQTAHVAIRNTLSSAFSNQVASSMQIQYGGSVTADSIADLMSMPDVDGALVGGASLVADSFAAIYAGSSSSSEGATAMPVGGTAAAIGAGCIKPDDYNRHTRW